MLSGHQCPQDPESRSTALITALGTLLLVAMLPVSVLAATSATDDVEPAGLELFRPGAGEGPDADLETAIQLGRIQRSNGEWLVAIKTLEDALERVRDERGPWDMGNVAVLSELAAAQTGMGNLDDAIGLYQEAVHINRVNLGLHDASQIALLDSLTEIHVQLADYATANQLQEYAFYVQRRTHGYGSLDLLPGLYRLANWWRRTGNIYSARTLYEQAIAILEAYYGPDDIRLIDPLTGLASTYRLERYPTRPLLAPENDTSFQVTSGSSRPDPFVEDTRVRLNRYGEGEAALARVVQIIAAHPESTARERAQSLLDLADWYLVFDKWTTAFRTYAQAREILVADGWDQARMESMFGTPTPLVFPLPEPPRPPVTASEIRQFEGYVDLVYDITDRGRVRSVDVTDSYPEGLMDFRTRKAVKAARFRPRFVAGEPSETNAVVYRHNFIYFRTGPEVEAEQASRAEIEAARAEADRTEADRDEAGRGEG